MFVYIQSYNIAVNMHASPVVPDCVRHCKNESKSDIAVSLFYKKINVFDVRLFVCHFKSYVESKQNYL